MARVLLTAIEPYGGKPMNSSIEAARLVAADPMTDVEVVVVELPCVFGEALDELRKAIARTEPDIVVATGQGGSRADITVELVAINLNDALAPDNKGNQPVDVPIVPDGPTAYFSSLPVKECVAAVRAAGVPAQVSHTAGTYVCNHIAYGLAHLIATERPDLRGGFVHIPYTPMQAANAETTRPPSMASSSAAEALRAVIRTAAFHDPQAETSTPWRTGPMSWLTQRVRAALPKA